MKKLIILSDMWGSAKSDWMSLYTSSLATYCEIKYYDCRELGDIPNSIQEKEALHMYFINGGVEKAKTKLLHLVKETHSILGFSIGGYLAWRACLAGLRTENIFAISSTRLRYETEKPTSRIELFYGDEDLLRPSDDWMRSMQIGRRLFNNEGHDMYLKKDVSEVICKSIISVLRA